MQGERGKDGCPGPGVNPVEMAVPAREAPPVPGDSRGNPVETGKTDASTPMPISTPPNLWNIVPWWILHQQGLWRDISVITGEKFA